MAFPKFRNVFYKSGVPIASNNINVPIPWPTVSERLAIIFINRGGVSGVLTPAAGWSPCFTDGNAFGSWYRVLNGSESDTVAFTAPSGTGTAQVWGFQLIGYQGNPEGTSTTGGSGSPNPPNLNPSWGNEDTKYIVAGLTTLSLSGPPSGYDQCIIINEARTTAIAAKDITADSEDPGTFTASSSSWQAGTIAVRQGTTANESDATTYSIQAPRSY